jgi:dihydroorotate dehydrogenase (fumarate)
MDLMTKLYNIELEHPLILGAGVCKHVTGFEGLEGYIKTVNASLLMVGSITLEKRDGNSGEVFWNSEDKQFALNCIGLENKGIKDIENNLQRVVDLAKVKGKAIGVSVANDITEKFKTLIELSFGCGASLVELNFSCPNTEGRIQGFDFNFCKNSLSALNWLFTNKRLEYNVCIKVPVYSDLEQLKKLSKIINETPLIKGISAVNSFPNSLYLDKHMRTVISSMNGFAGLSGDSLFPIALGQVAKWREYLNEDKYIIGGGGVNSGDKVKKMLKVGANAVSMVTSVLNSNPRNRVFDKFLDELI